jgi:hypothetical protein
MALAPSVARADPASDAKDLFARGRDLRSQGDCASAVGFFRKAFDLYPAGLGSGRNLAECEEQLGHFASARRAWLDIKRALVTTDDRKYDGWSQDADKAAARLAPKLAVVTIDVNVVGPAGAASPGGSKGVDVTLDGEPLAPALLGTPLERDPGRHVVRAAGARVQDAQQKMIDLAAGDSKRVALRVVVTPEATDPNDAVAPAQPGVATPDDAAEHSRQTRRTYGWISVGIGSAALVGALVSLVIRQTALNDVQNQCPSEKNCSTSLQPEASRGQTASTLFDVLGVVGVLAAGAGVALVLTSASPGQPQSGLVLSPAPGGAMATWRF